ncbi:MAG: hypothetical protein WCQ77_16060, partial [Planctomycetota bacterium]
AGAQTGIRLIERLVRYMRHSGHGPVSVDAIAAREPFARSSGEEIRAACTWLIQQGHGEWLDEPQDTFRLLTVSKPSVAKHRVDRARKAVRA